MVHKLFGENIKPACRYCQFCTADVDSFTCEKKGTVSADGKCMRYKYDPIAREPELLPLPAEHSPEEFVL